MAGTLLRSLLRWHLGSRFSSLAQSDRNRPLWIFDFAAFTSASRFQLAVLIFMHDLLHLLLSRFGRFLSSRSLSPTRAGARTFLRGPFLRRHLHLPWLRRALSKHWRDVFANSFREIR
jgi:hypothetical protein